MFVGGQSLPAATGKVGARAERRGAVNVLVLDQGLADLAGVAAMLTINGTVLAKAARDAEIYAVVLKSEDEASFCVGCDARAFAAAVHADAAYVRRLMAEQYSRGRRGDLVVRDASGGWSRLPVCYAGDDYGVVAWEWRNARVRPHADRCRCILGPDGAKYRAG
jgi:hypothetical protein